MQNTHSTAIELLSVRKFPQKSRLYEYLLIHCSEVVVARRRRYTLHEILISLLESFEVNVNFVKANNAILSLDPIFTRIFKLNHFMVKQLKECLLKHMSSPIQAHVYSKTVQLSIFTNETTNELMQSIPVQAKNPRERYCALPAVQTLSKKSIDFLKMNRILKLKAKRVKTRFEIEVKAFE